MTSNPKLPFPSEPTAVETSAEPSPDLEAHNHSGKDRSTRGGVSTAGLWLRRLGVLFFVFLCATVGVMLMILPWRPEWTENRLLIPYPGIRDVVSSGFIRGIVTGLGLLNVWIGFWEAIQYREER